MWRKVKAMDAPLASSPPTFRPDYQRAHCELYHRLQYFDNVFPFLFLSSILWTIIYSDFLWSLYTYFLPYIRKILSGTIRMISPLLLTTST